MHNLFPGSAAPLAAKSVLLSEIIMGLALIVGAVLARRQCYRAHAWTQSAVVLLNLPLVVFFMARSFWRTVTPGLFAHLGRSYYWLATAHGVLGACARTRVEQTGRQGFTVGTSQAQEHQAQAGSRLIPCRPSGTPLCRWLSSSQPLLP